MVVIDKNPVQLAKKHQILRNAEQVENAGKLDQNTSKKAAEVITGGMLEDKSQSSKSHNNEQRNKKNTTDCRAGCGGRRGGNTQSGMIHGRKEEQQICVNDPQ